MRTPNLAFVFASMCSSTSITAYGLGEHWCIYTP